MNPKRPEARRPGDPPQVYQVHARDGNGRAICGARHKQPPGVCGRHGGELHQNGRCRQHGGRAPGAPLTAGGEFSPTIQRLKAACAELQESELALLSPLPVIAKLAGICFALEERAAQLDSPGFRKALQEQAVLVRAGDPAALKALLELVDRGAAGDATLELLAQNLERLQKRIERALALKIDAERAMTEREMQKALIVWLGQLLGEFGDDPAALRVLSAMTQSLESTFGPLQAERHARQAIEERAAG